MKTAPPNPAAFPVSIPEEVGMSLRDYFAAAALAGLLADESSGGSYEEFAQDAYRYADQMLQARTDSTP